MPYEFLRKPLSPWQEQIGDYGDVVVDSRIRLSRNLKNYVFPQRRPTPNWRLSLPKGGA